MSPTTARQRRNQNEKSGIHHEGAKDTKVIVGCASRTGQSRIVEGAQGRQEQKTRSTKSLPAARQAGEIRNKFKWSKYQKFQTSPLPDFDFWISDLSVLVCFGPRGRFRPIRLPLRVVVS